MTRPASSRSSRRPPRPVPVAGYIGSEKDQIQPLIDNGNLPGVSIVDGTAVAVAGPNGVTFLDSATLSLLKDMKTGRPVTGMVLAERGPDQPTIYAAAGDRLLTLTIPSDGTDVTMGITVPMPNQVEKVYLGRGDDQRPRAGHTPGRQLADCVRG